MDLKKDRRNITVVIAVGSYRLVQRLLSGGESQQTRKGAGLVPQGTEASKNGRSTLILTVAKEHYFNFHQGLPLFPALGVAFAPPRSPPNGHAKSQTLRSVVGISDSLHVPDRYVNAFIKFLSNDGLSSN